MAKPFINIIADLADMRLTSRQAITGAIVIALSIYGVFALQLALAEGFITPAGAPVGGDFVAFWTAAKTVAAGHIAELYDTAFYKTLVTTLGPPQTAYNLTWQYPPTYFFAISFLAFLPFGLGYAVWTGGGFAVFAATIRGAGVKGMTLLIVLAAPVVFQAAITGQNGLFAASLLIGAGLFPDKRPMVAGLCAALLTMKPQLGVLLPIAYLAGGHWRAFGWAAAGSLALGLGSLAAFGLDPWIAFIQGIFQVSGALNDGVMALFKMPTVFAAFTLAGSPKVISLAAHGLGAIAALWATFVIWRRYDNQALRLGVVCAGAFFVSPYLFYYELVILAAPVALLGLQACEKGWRPHDQLILGALFLTPLFVPGDPRQAGFNIGFVVTALAFIFVLRQMRRQSIALRETQLA